MGNTQEACKPPGAPKNLQIQSVYCAFDLQIIVLQIRSSIIWSGFCILTLRSALIRYLRHLQMSTNITTRMLLTAMLLMSCLSYLSLLMVTTIHRMIQIINHTLMDISKSFNLQRVSVLLSCCLFFASLHRSLLCFYCCPCLSWLQGPIQGLHMKTWILF